MSFACPSRALIMSSIILSPISLAI
uniref:Uncharacterized protein n=1 Tax=Arundo donax TaxID=35708 RepID=A0A0A8Y9S6_ARUDO